MHRAGPLSHVEGDAELVSLNGGPIIPSHRSPFSAREVLRFISQPFRISQGLVIKESSFFSIASDSCTDRAAKKEQLFYVRAVVDGVMATNYFSCQPLPSGTAPGIVTALKRAMAHASRHHHHRLLDPLRQFLTAATPIFRWYNVSTWSAPGPRIPHATRVPRTPGPRVHGIRPHGTPVHADKRSL